MLEWRKELLFCMKVSGIYVLRRDEVVGNILHNNPDPSNYPCHRVVDSKGHVALHFAFGGGAMQRLLLEQEGITFEPDGSIDLKKYGM